MHRAIINQLAASITSTATSFNLVLPVANVATGSYISIEDELMYVVAASGNNLTVIRGMLGSTQAAHDGTVNPLLVEIQPRFPTFAIRQALQDEIRSWSPRLYGIKSFTLGTLVGQRGYDIGNLIDPAWIDVLDVRRSTNDMGLFFGFNSIVNTWPRVPFNVVRYADYSQTDESASQYPSSFPSGVGLTLRADYWNATMSVIYSVRMNPPDNMPDDVDLQAAMGFDPNWADIAPYGAAYRLLIGREAVRNITEVAGESRKNSEVPPQAIAQIAKEFQALRDNRINEAARTLRALFPVRFKG